MITILLRVFGVRHRRHVAILFGSVVAVVLIGGGLFAAAEDLPFTTGLYWAITTATTVGYGDITPHNPSVHVVRGDPADETVIARAVPTGAEAAGGA